METVERSSTNMAWILATLIGLGLAGGIYWKNNQALTHRYDLAEQRADSLLSVKFLLEGDNRELKRELKTATDDNAYLDRRNKKSHSQLTQSDRIVTDLSQSHIEQTRIIRNVADSLSQLRIIRDSLENQLVAMRDKLNWQSESNALLAHDAGTANTTG
ncbi:hypothetical protein GCM10028805_13730 [Spirosoma harenae]